MQVNFVTYGAVELKDDQLYSPLASARYRVIQPLHGLARRGHMVTLVQIGEDAVPEKVLSELDANIVIFSKLMTPDLDFFKKVSATTLTLIDRLHSLGRLVVADISDDYFERPCYGEYYRDLVNRVDSVVTSSPEMSASVARFTDRPVSVVTDPFEGPRNAPQFRAPARCSRGQFAQWFRKRGEDGESLRLVWFGHQSNWKTMRAVVESLLELRAWRIELEIITAPGGGVARFCTEFNAQHDRACRLRFTPWSLSATWEGLARAALVLIPSWPGDARKAVKGANRLVESLRAGRFVVANPLPAYMPLAPYCWLGDSMVEGLKWALTHPDEAQRRTLQGQAFVETTYSPEVVAGAWEKQLSQLKNGRT